MNATAPAQPAERAGRHKVQSPARTGLRTSAATGLNVRAVMARTGLSQTTLADALGLSQASVSARLRGVTPWSVDELVDTARVLDVHPHTLLDVDA